MLIDEFDSIFEKRWTGRAPIANLPQPPRSCHDILFGAAGFPRANPAGIDLDSLAPDLSTLHDAIWRHLTDNVYELLQRISPRQWAGMVTSIDVTALLQIIIGKLTLPSMH
jgi:hypothetical protein